MRAPCDWSSPLWHVIIDMIGKLSIFALALALPAAAQTTLTLDEAVRAALERRPELKAAEARVSASQGLKNQAGLFPNPRLILQVENLRGSNFDYSNDADSFAYFSQVIETSGRRGNRIAVGEANVSRSRLEEEQLRREIGFRVREAYWLALGVQFARDLYEQNDSYFKQVVEYHEARLKEGKIAEVDVLRVRLQAEQIHAALENARLDVDKAQLVLAREMGAVTAVPWQLTEHFDQLEEPRTAKVSVPSALVEARLAAQDLAAARANLGLARAAGRPDLDALFGYKRTAGLNTAIAGLQLNLPLFDRNQGARAAAQAETLAAQRTMDATNARLDSEAALARKEYEARLRQARDIFAPLHQQADQISDISRSAYREEGLDLLRLLDAERFRVEAQLAWLRALTDYHKSVVNLERAEGVEP
jgi:outer membrane protein, heavy metal efflux system